MENIHYINREDDYLSLEHEVAVEERNSNKDFSYYSLTNKHTIPDFTINKSVDVVTVKNIYPSHKETIDQILKFFGFIVKSDLLIEDKRYKKLRTYKNPSDPASIELFHGLTDYCKYRPTLKIKVHDPNQEILDLLSSSLRYWGLDPQLYEIELPFDFYSNDNFVLRGFIESHLIVKNQKIASFRDRDTYYTTDIRGCDKGIRVYGAKFQYKRIRTELVLKRSIIRELGLDLNLANIDSVDLSRFFYFGTLKENDAMDYLVKKYGSKKDQSKIRRSGYEDLVRRQLESFIGIKGFDKGTMMGKIEALKKTMGTNYNRFIEPYEDFNKKFFDMVSAQKFLKSKYDLSPLRSLRMRPWK